MTEDTVSIKSTTRNLFKDPTTNLVQQRDVDRVEQLAATIESQVRGIVGRCTFEDGKPFDMSTILCVLPLMMQTVETYRELPGPQKKAMVLTALKAALAAVVPLPYQPLVLPLVDPVIGAAIDFGVSAFHALGDEAAQLGSTSGNKCVRWCFSGRKRPTPPTTSQTAAATAAASSTTAAADADAGVV